MPAPCNARPGPPYLEAEPPRYRTLEKPMLTRRNFGLAGAGLVAAAASLRAARTEANAETNATTTAKTFEISMTPAHGPALLHERRRLEVHPQGGRIKAT